MAVCNLFNQSALVASLDCSQTFARTDVAAKIGFLQVPLCTHMSFICRIKSWNWNLGSQGKCTDNFDR